jgi:poly(A) polymerase
VDPATADAIREHAPRLERISPERIREELEKMLGHASRERAIALMAELGLMEHLWPGADWPPERVGKAMAVLAALDESNRAFVVAMAALLHDRSAGQAEAIGRALRCSNQEIADMAWLVGRQGRLGETRRLPLAEFKKLAAHPRFEDLLALHRAVCEAALRLWQEIPPDQIAPPPLVTGEDLIALGLEPGPEFKRILSTLYTAQLNNELLSREEALERIPELRSS